MQQPPLAPSSQEEATIPQSATASGETSEEDGLFFEKVFIPPPGENTGEYIGNVYKQLMENMQNTEPETKYREHTLDKLLGQFEQLDEQHRQLTREEDSEVQQIQALGLFKKNNEQEESGAHGE